MGSDASGRRSSPSIGSLKTLDRVVRIVPDVPALSRQFDYLTDDPDVVVGTRVRIALNGRRVAGWVTEVDVAPPTGVALQRLAKVSGWGPPPALFDIARWARWRWAGPTTSFLRTASPDGVVNALPEVPSFTPEPPQAATPIEDLVAHALFHTEGPSNVRLPPAQDLIGVVEFVANSVHSRNDAPPASVLVLIPNLGWAERLVGRLRRRGIPATSDWAQARAGWPVVVGSRSAAFAPIPRLGAVVVLDAHDEAYREERTPTFNAWEVAAERAWREQVPCLLVSPCPTAVQRSVGPLLALGRAEERAGWPALSVIDRRGADPHTGLYSEEFVRWAKRLLADGAQVVCVLNRTGRARLLACAQCDELVRCEHCGRSLEEQGGLLHCPTCGATRPEICANCGATRMKTLRVGVDRAHEELEALFGTSVEEVSGPKAKDESEISEMIPMLVGTEAVLHRTRRAGGVAFLDFDQHLLAQRFGANEEAMALLVRAGRFNSGRGTTTSAPRILVQTRMPEHEVLTAAVLGDPGPLGERESGLRAELSLPPYSALAVISGEGGQELIDGIGAEAPEVHISVFTQDRWLLRARGHGDLCNALDRVPRPKTRVRVEVDPTDV